MKKIKYLLLATIAASVLPLSAAQYVFVPANDRIETQICIAAAENKLSKFKHKAKALSRDSGVYRTIAKKLTCNEQPIADFAFQYDANKTVKFLDRFTGHDVKIRREISENKKRLEENETNPERIVYVTVE
ncbi:MAG: DUF3718 domain-containing protein [Kangiellaceae bacterium]